MLRIYWYDGALGSRPTLEQEQLAHLDNIKLRLGFINSVGQQKGVDSLIVTDLIELARLGAICDAILLSGDEDVRIGVQIAQNYGVRIHLLGIAPSRGSQSKALLQEADIGSSTAGQRAIRKYVFKSLSGKPLIILGNSCIAFDHLAKTNIVDDWLHSLQAAKIEFWIISVCGAKIKRVFLLRGLAPVDG